jgi:hypothetical protein
MRGMDATACGAKLISSQITTFWSDESSAGEAVSIGMADALQEAAKIAVAPTAGICLDCLLKAVAAGSATVVRE